MQQTDIAIIGGGIVGLATAYQLTAQYPDRHVLVLEKEDQATRKSLQSTPVPALQRRNC